MDAENLPKKLDNRHVAYWELQWIRVLHCGGGSSVSDKDRRFYRNDDERATEGSPELQS